MNDGKSYDTIKKELEEEGRIIQYIKKYFDRSIFRGIITASLFASVFITDYHYAGNASGSIGLVVENLFNYFVNAIALAFVFIVSISAFEFFIPSALHLSQYEEKKLTLSRRKLLAAFVLFDIVIVSYVILRASGF